MTNAASASERQEGNKRYGKKDLQLGRAVKLPASPDKAKLDVVPNPHPGSDYLVRFTAPEFTTLCPITGQPDFAHLVIDYVPAKTLVESKSLKLLLGSFRNIGSFHEDCTLSVAKRIQDAIKPKFIRIARLLVSARRHAHRCVLAVWKDSKQRVASRSRRTKLSGPGLTGSSGQAGDASAPNSLCS